VVDEENLYAIHEMLKITNISSSPFNVMIDETTPEDFLFLNPPTYSTLKEEPFMEFKRFNPEQFDLLLKSVHRAHDRGVKFIFVAPNADDVYLNAFKKYSAIIFRTQRTNETVQLVFHNLFGDGNAEIRSL
jgi:site-specific DNA-adenine methylase